MASTIKLPFAKAHLLTPSIATAALAAIAYLALAYGLDWWGMNAAPIKPVLTLRVLGAALAAVTVTALPYFFRALAWSSRLVTLGWLIYLSTWLLIIWPGFYMTDTNAAYKYSLSFPFQDWLGYFTPVHYYVGLQLIPKLWFLVALQAALTAMIIGLCDHVLRMQGAGIWIRLIPQLMLALNPSFLFNIFLLSRDTPFALGLLALIALVLRAIQTSSQPSRLLAATIGICAAVIVAIRSDGILPVAVTFCVIAAAWRAHWRAIATILTVTAIVSLVFVSVPSVVGRTGNEFGYEMSLKTNPLGYIIQNEFYSPSRDKDIATIDKVISVDLLRTIQKPQEIAAYWTGGMRWNSTQEERREFRKVYSRLVRDNLPLFLAGRVLTFAGSTGFGPGFRVMDFAGDWNSRPGYWDDIRPYDMKPFFPTLRQTMVKWLFDSQAYYGFKLKGSVLWWNFIPELLALIAFMLIYPLFPSVAALALILIVRVPAVFLLAPASQFKYYLSIEIGFPLVFAVLLLEIKKRTGAWSSLPSRVGFFWRGLLHRSQKIRKTRITQASQT